MNAKSINLAPITSLNEGILPLVIEAEKAGHYFMRRLQDEWESGENCFAEEGEFFLGAYIDGRILGVGGLNKDPYALTDTIGRLRHVYVAFDARRLGIATVLVRRIMDDACKSFSTLRLRTTTAEAATFYEGLGFQKTEDESATHIFEFHSTPSSV